MLESRCVVDRCCVVRAGVRGTIDVTSCWHTRILRASAAMPAVWTALCIAMAQVSSTAMSSHALLAGPGGWLQLEPALAASGASCSSTALSRAAGSRECSTSAPASAGILRSSLRARHGASAAACPCCHRCHQPCSCVRGFASAAGPPPPFVAPSATAAAGASANGAAALSEKEALAEEEQMACELDALLKARLQSSREAAVRRRLLFHQQYFLSSVLVFYLSAPQRHASFAHAGFSRHSKYAARTGLHFGLIPS